MRFAPPKVGQVRLWAGRFCFGRAGRCSALTRRNAILLHGVVNCGPAKGYVWPVLAPAEGLVRAGTVLRGGAVLLRRAAPGLCLSLRFCCNVLPSVHAGYAVLSKCLAFGSRLSFFLCQEKRDGLRCLAFLFRRVEIAIRAFSRCWRGYLPWLVHFGIVRLFVAIPTELRPESAIRKGTPFSCNVPFAINL